jgi:hypothetical protein
LIEAAHEERNDHGRKKAQKAQNKKPASASLGAS